MDLIGGGENASRFELSEAIGVPGSDCVITHSKESARLCETAETWDSLSYRSSGVSIGSGLMIGVDDLFSYGSQMYCSSLDLNAAGMDGLKENNGRQDILRYKALCDAAGNDGGSAQRYLRRYHSWDAAQ